MHSNARIILIVAVLMGIMCMRVGVPQAQAQITGFVFQDLNGDSIPQPSDPHLPSPHGACLFDPANSLIATDFGPAPDYVFEINFTPATAGTYTLMDCAPLGPNEHYSTPVGGKYLIAGVPGQPLVQRDAIFGIATNTSNVPEPGLGAMLLGCGATGAFALLRYRRR